LKASTRLGSSLLVASLLALPLAISLTCATTHNPNAGKYPPRPAGCKVRVFHSPAPDVKEWDDLGVAHVDCYLDIGAVQCLRKLRMEACRMGGDLLYDVPKKPLRPTEQGMVYTGHVAHTKAVDGGKDDESDAATGDQDQPAFESGPVQPLAPAAAARATADAGPARDGGGP
jgi:hypothetical protein